jgi:LAO/AO transport system kinase
MLGDRARIEIDPEDHGFFVRSMASGGELGGLASAAGAAVDVLSAAYDLVLVETTGVGQSETDVEHIADGVLMVIQPASGDVLQFLKAGIIEIPDVFAINKCDLGSVAQRAGADLAAALAAVHGPSGQLPPPVVHTSTLTRVGVVELLNALDAHHRALQDSGRLQDRRESAAARWAMRLFALRYGDFGIARAGGPRRLLVELRGLIRRGATAVEAVATLRPDFAR